MYVCSLPPPFRVRYCRLSHIRRLMGVCDEQPPFPPTFPADRVAIDEQYMAVYLVVNCIAEGLVLCFIHAAVDIHSGADNDEHNKSGWTNWCSTHGFDIPVSSPIPFLSFMSQ